MENIRSSSNSRDHGKKERLQKPDESLWAPWDWEMEFLPTHRIHREMQMISGLDLSTFTLQCECEFKSFVLPLWWTGALWAPSVFSLTLLAPLGTPGLSDPHNPVAYHSHPSSQHDLSKPAITKIISRFFFKQIQLWVSVAFFIMFSEPKAHRLGSLRTVAKTSCNTTRELDVKCGNVLLLQQWDCTETQNILFISQWSRGMTGVWDEYTLL